MMNVFSPKSIPAAGALFVIAALTIGVTAHAQLVIGRGVVVAPQYVVPQVVIQQPYVVAAPQAVVVAPAPAYGYVANPLDAFVVNAAPADVVYMNGDTYVWAVDERGNRYRRFYGHGDRRAEMFHRREELHRVMERNGGHLPGHEGFHGEARHEAGMAHREEHAAMEHREERAGMEHREAHAEMAHNVAMAHEEQAHPGMPGAAHPGAAPAAVAGPHPGAPAAPQTHAAAAPAPQAHPAAAAAQPQPQHKK